MSLNKQLGFRLRADGPSQSWSVNFSNVNGLIYVQLFWNEKDQPTHSFECSPEEFLQMAKELCIKGTEPHE